MFSKIITRTTLTDERSVLSHISGYPFKSDISFLATLKALLANRIPEDETIRFISKELRFEHVSHDYSHTLKTTFQSNFLASKCAQVILVSVTGAFSKEIMQSIPQAIATDMLPGYVQLEDLSLYFRQTFKFDALIYTNEEYKSTFIFIEKCSLKKYHALQTVLVRYVRWYFTEDNLLSEQEKALLKSLGNNSSVEYETLIEQFAEQLDIRGINIRKLLGAFEKSFILSKIDRITAHIDELKSHLHTYYANTRDTQNKLLENQALLAGYKLSLNEPTRENSVMDYFICNKNLTLYDVYRNLITFIAKGYADVYDEEAFLVYAENENSFLYGNLKNGVTKAALERLYRALFQTNQLRLRICAAYEVSLDRIVKALGDFSFPPDAQTYLPNPHIQLYRCIGNYEQLFLEYMDRQDYIGAIEQAAVSARNLNFHDSTVMTDFCQLLCTTSIPCIEWPDGNLTTPKAAMELLEQQLNQEETKEGTVIAQAN